MPTFPSYYTHQILPILIFIILLQYYHSASISASRTLLQINANEGHQNSTSDTDFVQQSCNKTTYPDLCCSTLSNYTNRIQNNPKELACAALNATLSEAQVASRVIKAKSGRAKGNDTTTTKDKRGAYAMKDCVEVLKDALDELKMSVEEMGRVSPEESDFRFRVNNVQTWVSAALTDDDTCMDGLEQGDKNTEDYKRIRDEVVKVAHLTSVALALINNYAATVNFKKI